MFTSIVGRLLLGVGLSILGSLLAKPPPGPKAAKLGDFGIVRADEGSSPLAIGGTYINWSAHIVAYGDFKTTKIKKKPRKK